MDAALFSDYAPSFCGTCPPFGSFFGLQSLSVGDGMR